MKLVSCNKCGKRRKVEQCYELCKLKGEGAGHWFFCSETCLVSWLMSYNPLLRLVE